MINEQWIPLKDAAAQLGVSEKTIRRRIQKGEIESQLVDSPYGKMYVVSSKSINTAQQVMDVVKVNREFEVKELAIALAHYMEERDAKLIHKIDELEEKLLQMQENHLKAMDIQLEKFKEELGDKKKGIWGQFLNRILQKKE